MIEHDVYLGLNVHRPWIPVARLGQRDSVGRGEISKASVRPCIAWFGI